MGPYCGLQKPSNPLFRQLTLQLVAMERPGAPLLSALSSPSRLSLRPPRRPPRLRLESRVEVGPPVSILDVLMHSRDSDRGRGNRSPSLPLATPAALRRGHLPERDWHHAPCCRLLQTPGTGSLQLASGTGATTRNHEREKESLSPRNIQGGSSPTRNKYSCI